MSFESLICRLDVLLSSLLIAFISLFFSLWKTPFLQAWRLLDKSSIDSLSIEPSFSFLDRSSTVSQSIEEFFRALCLLDSISIDSWSIEISRFLLDRILTASRLIKISGFLLDTFSNAIGKHRLGPHPFKSQTSKPPCMQSPGSQCQNHVFTANFWKLRFYQNNGLSSDKRCGVPNTFPTCNQTPRPKNQDFLPSTLD